MNRVGVIIGRFQVPSLHAGHRALIQHVAKHNDLVHIFVGVAPFRLTRRDPLSYEAVMASVNDTVRSLGIKAYVCPLPDRRSDEDWSHTLDTVLNTVHYGKNITLYTGRDGFNEHYKGKLPVEVVNLEEFKDISATEIRKSLEAYNGMTAFRQGVVWAIENQYPLASVCVDAIVLNTNSQVLLVRKNGETRFRFPGGFVDPDDTSLEHAVRRELQEESPIPWHTDPKYVFSMQIKDWRSSLITNVFEIHTNAVFATVPDGGFGEIGGAGFFDASSVTSKLVEEHIDLWLKFREIKGNG